MRCKPVASTLISAAAVVAVKQQFWRLEGCESEVDADAMTLTRSDALPRLVKRETLLVVAPDDFLEMSVNPSRPKAPSGAATNTRPPDSSVSLRRSDLRRRVLAIILLI